MEQSEYVKPLPYNSRRNLFAFLVIVFLVVLPFLYLYATGYRFDFAKPTNIVSTGGIYVAADRTGAQIYIDDELVRETRAFRQAFYAQNLDVGTHRVHVQKDGHHTWVKELPVSEHLVTEAAAFNMPLIPDARLIAKWDTATGSPVVKSEIAYPHVVNAYVATTTKPTAASFKLDQEYTSLMAHFASTSTSTASRETTAEYLRGLLTGGGATTTDEATSTKISSGVRLALEGDDLFATWVGPFEQMPYYYCAPTFPPYSTSTPAISSAVTTPAVRQDVDPDGLVMHPVQAVPAGAACDPTVKMDRKGETLRAFDFYPGSTDLILEVLEDGIYVVEIDDRGWQNMQPLMEGRDLDLYIENGNVFVYDGSLIYQILLQSE
ncbi:MAG TPA: hypothetical protein VFS75_00775 [Candidatus Paceibacterota bacterium]|nr:hypothetical protein [Candidatus Paceibacterota bacterium]